MLVHLFTHLIVAFFVLPGTADGYQVGETVAPFTLPSVQGSDVSLTDFANQKGLILIFDCNTCPYSQAYRDRIKDLHVVYADKGYPVVAINPNDPVRQPGDSFDKMKAYAAEHGYKHHYLQDVDQSVTKAFGATNTPHVFVLENESGSFVVRYIGAIDNNTRSAAAADKKYVEEAVNSLLSNATPEVSKTKAIGCSIKWKAS